MPVEVLAAIFELGSQRGVLHVLGDEWPKGHIDNKFVARVSHVCQHWRSVGFEQPALWQSLILGEGSNLWQKAGAWAKRAQGSVRELLLLPPMSNDMLARNTPLVATLRKHVRTPPTVLRIQAPFEIVCSPRVQRAWLEATFSSYDIPSWALELSPSLPILKDFYPCQHSPVESLREFTMRRTCFCWDWWDIPDEMGSDDGGEETHPHIAMLGPGLRILKLRDVNHIASELKPVLSNLSTTPDLHTLLLGGSAAASTLTLDPGEIEPAIHLGRLEHFELAGSWVDSATLLGHLSLPKLQTL